MSTADEAVRRADAATGAAVATAPGGAVLVLDVPDGWTLGDADGVAAVLVRETSPSGFRTNAMVQATTVPAAVSLDDVVVAIAARAAATYDAVDERGCRPTRAGDAVGVVRLVCFDLGPHAARLAQLQLVLDAGPGDARPGDAQPGDAWPGDAGPGARAPADGPGRRAVFTVALTCAAVDLPELGEELAAVVRTARVLRPAPQP
jgi:hypothetical protein